MYIIESPLSLTVMLMRIQSYIYTYRYIRIYIASICNILFNTHIDLNIIYINPFRMGRREQEERISRLDVKLLIWCCPPPHASQKTKQKQKQKAWNKAERKPEVGLMIPAVMKNETTPR